VFGWNVVQKHDCRQHHFFDHRLRRSFDTRKNRQLGGPDSFEEKYFPTLKKYSAAAAKIKVGAQKIEQAKEIEELKKATTLTFHLKSGKIKTWPAFGTYFEPEVTREFITLLDQTAPDDMNFHVDSE